MKKPSKNSNRTASNKKNNIVRNHVTKTAAVNEKLSERDLRELMGENQPRYGRRRGAIRQK